MASPSMIAVLYGFSVLLFTFPQLLGEATEALASPWSVERLAATVFFPAVLVTLLVTPLLSFAHVGALGGGGGLAKMTVLAATVALLAGALLQLGAADDVVVQIGADGHLDRGRGDVARLNIK